jgi:hypothetical protein
MQANRGAQAALVMPEPELDEIRSGDEWRAITRHTLAGERARQLGEDRQVSVKLDAPKSSDSEGE